ncbi:MAG: 3-hydroxyacyl-ACP dehydratase FabZ [Candidatus Gastranaerophilales bacterium]|nr:3-hydroxyacyl-ACP dehydratase FabZ [Candidatus Gastranaerophilales bacterium]
MDTVITPITMDYEQILQMLPHRYPFLLVDRITECIPAKYSKGYKNVTFNEPFFQGHFPENPIMPGVLQIEALAQTAAPILMTMDEYKGKLTLFAGVDGAKFKNIVRPGDKLEMETECIKIKGPIAKCLGRSFVDGKLCCEATLTVALK